MRKISALLLLASLLLIPPFAAADDESPLPVKVTINKKRIFIGDRIRYKVQISSDSDLEIEFPKFKDSKVGECEIKDSGKSVKKSIFGKRTYINWLDITSYYVGKRTIPAIEIKYKQKSGNNWKQLKTDELIFTVETVLPKGVKLNDIKDIKGILYPFNLPAFIVLTVVSLVALWLLAKFVLNMIFKKAPLKLPHEVALEEIMAAGKEFNAGGSIKEYYVRISDAVRRYIESVFSLKAPEMTTQEFLISLGNSSKLPPAYKDLLKVFMEACDLVKFAKYTPARSDIESVLNTASKFIEETKEIYMKKEDRGLSHAHL